MSFREASDGFEHVVTIACAGDAFIPAGTYVGFEELPDLGDQDFDDHQSVFTGVQSHAKRKPPIRGANWRRDFEAVKELCGFGSPATDDATADEKKLRGDLKPWPQDVLRHTGISCHYRVHGDEGLTAAWVGNSRDMRIQQLTC